ncbi:MAG: MerR family transcriptional regulator [Candidatus Marinimicrobia bacterium]|nr:MerR family transcriptional regulator [Candidatus Neomarinimicrobiota bacterium]MCH7954450.1 MerR family transcriptional regulator [Candidatus Neomarinimicrobiota bacterium]
MNQPQIKKLYYSIGEVAELTSLKPYVLRYWETEFPALKPTKNRAGNRIYKDRDLKILFHIKYLLYDQKYTIEGARKQLKSANFEEMMQSGDSASNLSVSNPQDGENNDEDKLISTLSVIRNGLLDLKKILED